MIKAFFLFLLFTLLNNLVFSQASSKPFPQHVIYFNGVIKPSHVSQQIMDESVRSFYKAWKQQYIKVSKVAGQNYVCSKGSAGKNECVSEGQGYGMIITALMAGEDSLAQDAFDGLFRYYQAHLAGNSKYLMAWAQTNSFKNVDGSSAADGDMDIAYSLLLADIQWGSGGDINYAETAKAMLEEIMKQEINPTVFSVMLSNAVTRESNDYFDMRSSDFMPAHFKAFSSFLKGKGCWDSVVNKNYALFDFLQNKYSKEAGLFPDFIQHINVKAVPARANYLESKFDGNYNYNACRVPWRVATDFILNGEVRSKKIAGKINEWIRGTTQNIPDNISAGYTLAGDDMHNRNFEAMSFISSFAVSAMVDVKNQVWLNHLWDYIVGFNINDYDYYDNSIKMINILMLSGNYWQPDVAK